MTEFIPHEMEWTPERIKRFWDFWHADQNKTPGYFSFQAGEHVAWWIRHVLRQKKDGLVIDWGAGRGHLVNLLRRRGYGAFGYDPHEHVGLAHGHYVDEETLWDQNGRVSLLVCCHVLEHLPSEEVVETIKGFHRLLRPGGRVLAIVPNAIYERGQILCPDCGAIFHQRQHLRAFRPAGLKAMFEDAGFGTKLLTDRIFWGRPWKSAAKRLLRYCPENITYVGRKGGA